MSALVRAQALAARRAAAAIGIARLEHIRTTAGYSKADRNGAATILTRLRKAGLN